MAIVGGFDIHRRQVTFDYLGTETSTPTGLADRGKAGHPRHPHRLIPAPATGEPMN